jgi:hypothetical protein
MYDVYVMSVVRGFLDLYKSFGLSGVAAAWYMYVVGTDPGSVG